MLVLIARRPDVVSSRKWTTAKTARVTVNAAAVRWHFHHWAASVARCAEVLKARLAAESAAAELQRQADLAYTALEAAYEREQREQELLFEQGEDRHRDLSAFERLVNRGQAIREDARLEALVD